MKISEKRRPPLRLCTLVVLSLGLLFSPGSAWATAPPGGVIAWGCGDGADVGQCNVPPEATSGVTAVAAGDYHSLALKDVGSVVAWGCGGVAADQCAIPAAATSGVTAIAAGYDQSLALKQDGSVIAWGCGGFDG